MQAYKWLSQGAVDPDTEGRWNAEDWTPMKRLFSKQRSIAYSGEDLAATFEAELWEIEAEGKIEPYRLVKTLPAVGFTAKRGRLLRRVEAWNDELAGEVAKECILRARDLLSQAMGMVADLGLGDPAALRDLAGRLAAARTRADIEAAAARFESLPGVPETTTQVPVVAVSGLLSNGQNLWEATTAVMTDPPHEAARMAAAARTQAAGRIFFAEAVKADETDFDAVWASAGARANDEQRLLAASLRERLGLGTAGG